MTKKEILKALNTMPECKAIRKIVQGREYFGVVNVKADKSIRKYSAQFGIQKGLKGVGRKYNLEDRNHLGIWESNTAKKEEVAYRTINCNTMIQFRHRGVTYIKIVGKWIIS